MNKSANGICSVNIGDVAVFCLSSDYREVLISSALTIVPAVTQATGLLVPLF